MISLVIKSATSMAKAVGDEANILALVFANTILSISCLFNLAKLSWSLSVTNAKFSTFF